MKSINVLHVIDKLSMDGVNPSSCAKLLVSWSEHLSVGRDCRMSVCTLRDPDLGGAYLEQRGMTVHYLPFGKYSPRNVNGILRLIQRQAPDILHLHGYSAANFGRLAARRAGIVNVVHEHAVLPAQPHQYVADFLLRPLTDSAVAVSSNVRDFMIRTRHIPRTKIRVVPNGVDLTEFCPTEVRDVAARRRQRGLPERARLVGTVTRFRAEKGTEFLLRAAPEVLNRCTDTIFVILGDGPLKPDLERLAVDLGIRESVRFVGFQRDVPEWLSMFDVNVIPSLTEGFPLSLIEAMAAGNAVVASAVGAIGEVADDGRTALLVPPKDPARLAAKIVHLLTHPDVAASLSASAQEASRKYDAQSSAAALRELYTQLVNGRA